MRDWEILTLVLATINLLERCNMIEATTENFCALNLCQTQFHFLKYFYIRKLIDGRGHAYDGHKMVIVTHPIFIVMQKVSYIMGS